MRIILYTQDHKPLLLAGTVPTPFGQIALQQMQALCRKREIPLLELTLAADHICLCTNALSSGALRELLTAFRRSTDQLATRLAASSYNAVLWQRRPVVEED